MFIVTRQRYWPGGQQIVEISQGGWDSVGSDMLGERYTHQGEGKEVSDPREALRIAHNVAIAWGMETSEPVRIGAGNTWGGSLPLEEMSLEQLQQWAQALYEQLPKCDQCGDILPDRPVQYADFEGTFCSEQCGMIIYDRILAHALREERAEVEW